MLVPDWDLDEIRAVSARQLTPTGVALHRNGHTLPTELTVAALGGPGGQVTVFLRDVSARIRLEQEADRMRDELIANISHELPDDRSPRSSATSSCWASWARTSSGPGAARRPGVRSYVATRAASLRLVNDLLAVSFVDEYLARHTLELIDLAAGGRPGGGGAPSPSPTGRAVVAEPPGGG